MYQVVITEPDGQVHGKTFSNPVNAIQEFGKYFADPKYEHKGQVMFQQIGQLVCTLDNYKLTHGEVLKDQQGHLYVNFHAQTAKQDFISQYQKYATEKDSPYQFGALIDLKTQEVVLAFDEGTVYGLED